MVEDFYIKFPVSAHGLGFLKALFFAHPPPKKSKGSYLCIPRMLTPY